MNHIYRVSHLLDNQGGASGTQSKEKGRCRERKREREELKQLNWLTIRGFLSFQCLALSVAITGEHRDLITRLWGETLQNCVCDVSSYCLFSSFLSEKRLPPDPVLTNVPGSRSPFHTKTGVSDVAGRQVSGWAECCGWITETPL